MSVSGYSGIFTIEEGSAAGYTVPTPRITLANYPNPFNPNTEIRFQISDIRQIEHAEIEIFNLLGQKVKAIPIHTDELSSRPQWRDLSSSTTWDGTDSNGQPVASGLYLYRLVAGGKTLAQSKMMLLK
jgi:flagellar hook assembly protein FlgD